MPQDAYGHTYCSPALGTLLFKYKPFLPDLKPDGWCTADNDVTPDYELYKFLCPARYSDSPVFRADTLLRYNDAYRSGDEEEDPLSVSLPDHLAIGIIEWVEQQISDKVLAWA